MENLNLGKCCCCETSGKSVRNIMSLHFKSPDPKGGWGCFVCGLPPLGAVAVLCDDCHYEIVHRRAEIKFACLGYPGENRRIEIEKLTEVFDHDSSKHPESWDWEKALAHFRDVRWQYIKQVGVPGVNATLALENVFRPLSFRYHRGERTVALFDEMMAVE